MQRRVPGASWLLLAASTSVSVAMCACGGRALPVITIDVDVETMSPEECLPSVDLFEQRERCDRSGRDVVFDPGCGNRDLDSDEPVATFVDPNDVNALVFIRYAGPDALLRDGGDQGPGPATTGVMLHELTVQQTFDVTAAHDTNLLLYTLGLDGSLVEGAQGVIVGQDSRDGAHELELQYFDGETEVHESHSVSAVTEQGVQLEDGRFVNENFCGCSAGTTGATGAGAAVPLAAVLAAAAMTAGRRRRARA